MATLSDVGIDAGRDAGILHLDRQHAAVWQLGAVNLPDRGGSDRMRLEVAEAPPPVAAPLGAEHLIELPGRHVVCVVAQAREDPGEFGWQQVAGVQRDHLPELHCGAAQVGELVGRRARRWRA